MRYSERNGIQNPDNVPPANSCGQLFYKTIITDASVAAANEV